RERTMRTVSVVDPLLLDTDVSFAAIILCSLSSKSLNLNTPAAERFFRTAFAAIPAALGPHSLRFIIFSERLAFFLISLSFSDCLSLAVLSGPFDSFIIWGELLFPIRSTADTAISSGQWLASEPQLISFFC